LIAAVRDSKGSAERFVSERCSEVPP
jgi:hypothetical protein